MTHLNIEILIDYLLRVSDDLYTCWTESRNDELTASIDDIRHRVNRLIQNLRVLEERPDE
jgi:hypothetical protein